MQSSKEWIRKEIIRSLVKENPKIPSKDFIQSYKDFLKHKDVFIYYNFNSTVFENLLIIAHDVYINNKRHNKRLLFNAIKSYYHKRPKKYVFPELHVEMIFDIFQRSVFEKNEYIKGCANSLLIGTKLKTDHLFWLTENFERSDLILNRLLRYPEKSKLITDWAFRVFLHDKVKSRRAEVSSWIIDEQPRILVTKETIINDFYYMNKSDKKEYDAFYHIDNSDFETDKPNSPEIEMGNVANSQKQKINSYFSFKQDRFYLRKHSEEFDPELTEKEFLKNIDVYLLKTQLWALFYSRIDLKIKEKRMIELYDESIAASFLYIAKKLSSIRLLKWLKNNI